ncbi:lipase family protein [Sorangium sp. So ce1000]|uniref:lipase family protein n=1 Tax=Sorangium sp. So ce1000 TaxID=3133325 RepID=UPI003F61E8F1
MKFDTVRVIRPSRRDVRAAKAGSIETWSAAAAGLEHVDKVDHMVQARAGEYDRHLASILGAASSWSYSDPDTFAKVMHRRAGVPWNETVALTAKSPAILTDSTAYLVQSEDRRLCILSFRGTGMLNLVNWLSNASSRAAPFLSAGHIHGGFFRTAMMLAAPLRNLLQSARKGGSICDAVARERAMWCDCLRRDQRDCRDDRRHAGADVNTSRGVLRPPSGEDPDVLEALYITGHSLGGALAIITAALLFVDPGLAYFREKLRGVYTYGQPMVGYQDFKDRFERDLGKLLFRHVYRNDVFPHLPACTMGPFVHFGSLYTAKEGAEWMSSRASTRQACTLLTTLASAAVAGISQEILIDVPLLARVPLRVSIADHAPLNYLRASQQSAAGVDLL